MISADSLYIQGSSHTVCQDYTRTGSDNEIFSYGILSDGCSGSPDTDIGARFLVLETEKILQNKKCIRHEDFCQVVSGAKYRGTDVFNISPLALDATLYTIYVNLNHKVAYFRTSGDGLVLARKRGTQIYDVRRKHFPNGAPWYLSYSLNEGRFLRLMDEGLLLQCDELSLNQTTRTYETECYRTLAVDADTRNSFSVTGGEFFELEKYDLFLIVSDGIESFVQAETKTSIPYQEILYELLDFKNFNGEFLARRLRKILKDFQKKHWTHEDDLSVAAIYVGE